MQCDDPDQMLASLGESTNARKLRLFGCACCRSIWTHFTDDGCRSAVEVAERYADGEATVEEVNAAHATATFARDMAVAPVSDATRKHRSGTGRDTSWAVHYLTVVPGNSTWGPYSIWGPMKDTAAYARAAVRGRVRENTKAQVALLRDIFDHLFAPPSMPPAWVSADVRAISLEAYKNRSMPSGHFDPVRLAVLSDALEEAGCTDAAILDHLRYPGPHVRGCWAVDGLTGRS